MLPYRPVSLPELQSASASPMALHYLLAVKFNYDVKQGGFAQLLYNLRGEFLGDVEDMLIAANAVVAHDYYIRAITACVENNESYFRFVASGYTEANDLKHSLQLLSVQYLQHPVEFVEEAATYLATLPTPGRDH